MSKGAFEVTRKIPLLQSASEKWQDAARRLREIEPVIAAQVNQHGQLRIRYDAANIDIENIETLLDEVGIARKNDFWWKWKRAWYRYVDENAQANAHASGGACCNRPPSANGSTPSANVKVWHIQE